MLGVGVLLHIEGVRLFQGRPRGLVGVNSPWYAVVPSGGAVPTIFPDAMHDINRFLPMFVTQSSYLR